MALERRIDTDVWDDTWFSELPVDGKLLFLFLLTNRRTSSCGAYEVSIRQMAFETGIDAVRVSELLETFGDRIQWWPQHQIVFVRNFYRRQKPNPSYETNARKAAAELPVDVRDTVYRAYPMLRSADDTLSSIEETPEDTRTTPSIQPVDRVSPVLELELVRELEPERELEEGEARVSALSPSPSVDDPFVRETAGMVSEAVFVGDDLPAIVKAVARSFQLVPDFDTRDGPFQAGQWAAYYTTGKGKKNQPTDWVASFRNWLKKAVQIEQRDAGESRLNGGSARESGGGGAGTVDPDIQRRGYDYDAIVASRHASVSR